MLAFGRERAAAAGVDNIEFVESDAMSLDFPADSFDAAVSRWGIIFDPDGEGAAARVRGFLKPGARFAISSWGPPERSPFLAIPMRTVMQRLASSRRRPARPARCRGRRRRRSAACSRAAASATSQVEESEVTFEYPSPEEFTTFVREIAPPITALMAGHPPEEQAETWAAITEAIREVAQPDGSVTLTNQVLMASGRA